eukprot:scaffold3050_cov99-Isochrysis_galbana.AAC.1
MPARPEDAWRHRPRHALHRRGHPGANASLAAVSVAGSSASVAVADAPWLSLVCQSLAGQQTELALLLFSILLCLVAWLFATRRQSEPPGLALAGLAPAVTPAELTAYRRLRNRYLLAYSLATFGDWIQGGYLYALYAQHGYSMRHIALLFVVGYASAATAGTYSSAVGDVGGHRRNCVAYGLIYSVSCLLANSPDVGALVVRAGAVPGGGGGRARAAGGHRAPEAQGPGAEEFFSFFLPLEAGLSATRGVCEDVGWCGRGRPLRRGVVGE